MEVKGSIEEGGVAHELAPTEDICGWDVVALGLSSEVGMIPFFGQGHGQFSPEEVESFE